MTYKSQEFYFLRTAPSFLPHTIFFTTVHTKARTFITKPLRLCIKFINETMALGFSRSLLRLSPILPLYVYLYIHIHLKHAFLFSSTLQILIQKVRPLTLMIVTSCLKATAVMTVHMKTCHHSLIHQKVSFIQFLNNFIS